MGKLLPPLIECSIPAFYYEKGTVNITVPFAMNKAVRVTEFNSFALKVKSVQSNTFLISVISSTFTIDPITQVTFQLDNSQNIFRVGQFYKLQIAYIDIKGTPGDFSTVGVIKCTTEPDVEIKNFDKIHDNMHDYRYYGHYSQKEKDISERVYNYIFNVYDASGKIFATSGKLLHDSSNDTALDESEDEFFLGYDLPVNIPFDIDYTVYTINGIKKSSPKYRILQKLSIDPEMKADLVSELNYENGYIDINIVGIKDNETGLEDTVTGAFLLSRSSEDTNFALWEDISNFKLIAQTPSRWLWRDYTIEQGKTYQYSLQQYNDAGLYSNRILSNKVKADYEDAFLGDEDRQLKIKYNPKVSSFKTTLAETKTDTIGGKFPFIFKNGRMAYKEFPISGLISHLMDDENLFYNKKDKNFFSTDLTSDNITLERDFKLEVLKWLTNGKPKIFRSPTEGNYIVRLMNVSLTPNDTVGRMLHTFNCTAYEIAPYDYKHLNEYNFIHLDSPAVEYLRWETIPLFEKDNGKILFKHGKINKHTAYTVHFIDMMPGDLVSFIPVGKTEPISIRIGVTGSYSIDLNTPISDIIVPDNAHYTGSVTYSYYSKQQNKFNKIADVTINEIPVRQFIGEHNILRDIEYVQMENGSYRKNPKTNILTTYNFRASKRSIEKIFQQPNGQFSTDEAGYRPLSQNEMDKFVLYLKGHNVRKQIAPNRYEVTFVPEMYYDPTVLDSSKQHLKPIALEDYNPTIIVNGNTISVDEKESFYLEDVGKLKELKCGNGVAIEYSYQINNIDYHIESDTRYPVFEKKNTYLKAQKILQDYLSSESIDYSNSIEQSYRLNVDQTYLDYIRTLIIEQDKEKVADGLAE